MSTPEEEIAKLRRRLAREIKSRQQAEEIAESVTSSLYEKARELECTNDKLEALNQSLREFAAIAAHDLKAPLTVIMGTSRTLERGWEKIREDQRFELLHLIENQGVRMNRLIQDLLMISRIESGGIEAHPEIIPVEQILVSAAADFRDMPIKVPKNVEKSSIVADRDHVQRILVNFLDNAFKYGDPPVELEVRPETAWIHMRVRDLGPGVAENFVSQLFLKFSRAEDPITRNKPGSGLGLSIVAGLARANGGDVWYEPNIPQGSCFGVRLRAA